MFADNRDDDSDDDLDDQDIHKIMIVTQTPPPKKHDRTGDFVPRSKLTQELSAVINDGLFYYEQVKDLPTWLVFSAGL